VPALITEPVAATVGTGVGSTQLPGGYGSLSFKVVGTIDGSPALPNGGPRPVLVVSSAAVAQQLPHAKDLVDAPNAWFGLGNGISSADLRKLLTSELTTSQGAGNGVGHGKVTVNDFFSIATRGDTAAGIGAGPLQRSATQLFWAAVVIAAGYSLLSLLLTLLRAAPERAALLARLRAMGLRPRQGVVLILCEALPQALAAAAAGAGIAYLSVPLLGSAVNLSPMVGTAVPGGLRIEAAAVAWQAAALAGLCTLVVLVETALTGRRQINTELRVGDQR
jgi:putative ABC transport system permease protein